jgi:SAM-dependent methyltransferase
VAEADRIVAEYARRAAEIPADRYSPAAPAQLLLRQSRERAVLAVLRRAGMLPLAGRRILDVGCGTGQWLADFETWGADRDGLAGIDLVEERIAAARARLTPGADLRLGDASRLPWPSGHFDLVLQSTVFSSILDAGMRTAVAGEMARVLAPSGAILWNDFFVGSPGNRAVRGMRRKEVAALFPGFHVELRRVTLAAPLARLVAPHSQLAGIALEALRLFGTHYVGLLRRNGGRRTPR